MIEPRQLYADRRHRILHWPAPSGTTGQRLLVTFEHGRDGMRRFGPPTWPKLAGRHDLEVMAVQTARRDWYVSYRSGALAEALSQLTEGYRDVVLSGFSMGAYAALLYSRAAHARRVLAVSPQYSIDPAVAPFDPMRHRKFRLIGRPMPLPQEMGDTQVKGLLIYDPTIAPDRQHAALIAAHFPRLSPCALPYGGHPATGALNDAGAVGTVTGMVIEDTIDASAVRALHRKLRSQSERYRLRLAMAASIRHPARAAPALRQIVEDPQAEAEQRLEAAIQMIDLQIPGAFELLSQLLEDVPDPPQRWMGRITRAIDRNGGF